MGSAGTRVAAMRAHLPGSDLFVVHEEVQEALDAGVGVVALESTILAHGLPHPDNIEIGAQIEDAVRTGGSVPATIAVLDGVVHVGLGAREVERVCTDPDIAKLSVRDVGVAAALGLSGATTVASTSALAHLAGIGIFATGGLGGVHRGASETFDVSADLGVIASTPVLVVCAGVKSILDVAGTLETLETLSVPVLGYRTDAFPGFYLSDSGQAVPWRVESAAEAARVVVARARLGTDAAGVVLANPLPVDRQVERGLHDRLVEEGLALLEREGVHGKDVTPRLLEYFHDHSGGESLRANVELVLSNAALAGEVAAEVATQTAARA
jgi:pseudouridine-5'-phosphate glycosidase